MTDIYVPTIPQGNEPSQFQRRALMFGPRTDVTALQQANLNMDLILSANPYMANDPNGLMRLATSGADPEVLVENAGALAGIESIDKIHSSLLNLNPVAQRSVYNRLTEQQQRALDALGFHEPAQPDKGFLDGTPLEGAWDFAAGATSKVLSPVGTVVAPVAGHAFDLLTWISDVPAHFYRAIRQMEGWQQWLALGLGAAAVVATGGAALAGFAPAAAYLGGASAMGSLGVAGALGAAGLGAAVAATAPTAITNPTEWWDLMNPFGAAGVGRGERAFTAGARGRARDILGGASHLDAIARDFAMEMSVEELVEEFAGIREATNPNVYAQSVERVAAKMADPGTFEYQQLVAGFSKLAEQEDFRRAVEELQAGKISIGRDVANTVGLKQGSGWHSVVSGGVDAFWLLTMDPTLALGKLGKLQRIARRGIGNPSGEEAIKTLTRMVNEDPAVTALASQVADAVNNNRFMDMPKAWRPLFNPIRRHFENSGNAEFGLKELQEYINTGNLHLALMEGKATVPAVESIVIDVQNKGRGWGRFVESLRGFEHGMSDRIYESAGRANARRWGVDYDLERAFPRYDDVLDTPINWQFEWKGLDGPPVLEMPGYQAGRAFGQGLVRVPGGRTLGNFIAGISTMIPAGKALKMTPGDLADMRDMSTDLPRFINAMGRHMNMPAAYRYEWTNIVMSQPDVAMRRNALVSFMESTFDATGFKNLPAYADVAANYLHHYKQAYALGGLDVLDTFMDTRITGIYPDLHQAAYMVMPDIKEMSKVVRQGYFIKHIAKVTDHDFAEQAMSRVIKPGWLMRIGFIPRAAGEEMLAFALRMNEGGLLQQFAGRRWAGHRALRDAQFALVEAGGDMRKLTAQQKLALDIELPSHLKPLAWIGRRVGWETPEASLVNRYWDKRNHMRQFGMGVNITEANMPEWARVLIAGRPASLRRYILEGLDPNIQASALEWTTMHSDNVMRSLSALNASDLERAVVNPDATEMMVWDPAEKKRVTMNVRLTGEHERTFQGDQLYQTGVHHRALEPFMDSMIREPVAEVNTLFFDPERIAPYIDQNEIVQAFYNVGQFADGFDTKTMLLELLTPRPDNIRATAAKYDELSPPIASALRRFEQNSDHTLADLQRALDDARESYIIEAASKGEVPDDGELNRIRLLQEKLGEMEPTIEWVRNIADPGAREWAAAVVTRQVASDHTAWNPDQVQRWVNGGGQAYQPKRVLYRGVKDGDAFWWDEDGNLYLRAFEQSQWNSPDYDDVRAISLSTDPRQSLFGYATSRTDLDWSSAADADTSFMSGFVVEMDADAVYKQYGTSHLEVTGDTTTYSGAEYDGVAGPRMVGLGSGVDATEIAVVMHGQDYMKVEAGRWRIQSSSDMESIRALEAAAKASGEETSRWTGRWHKAKTREEVIAGSGVTIEEAVPIANQKIDDFFDSLTDEEMDILEESMTVVREDFYDAAQNSFEAYKATEPGIEPEGLFARLAEFGTVEVNNYDPETLALLTKLEEFMKTEVKPGATVADTINAITVGEARNAQVEDLFAQRWNRQKAKRLGYDDLDAWDPNAENPRSYQSFVKAAKDRNNPDVRSIAPYSKFNWEIGSRMNQIDTKYGQSVLDVILRSGMEKRGAGGWDELAHVKEPAPFITDYDTYRERLASEIEARLYLPENQDRLRMSERSFGENVNVARPPREGTARVYSPVIPADTRTLETIVNRLAEPGWSSTTPSWVRATRARDTFNGGKVDVTQMSREELKVFLDDLVATMVDVVRPRSQFKSPNRWKNSAMLGDASEMGRNLPDTIYDINVALAPSTHNNAPVSETLLDALRTELERDAELLEDAFRHITDETAFRFAEMVLEHGNTTAYTDSLIDRLSGEDKLAILTDLFDSITQRRTFLADSLMAPLDNIAYDDPRIAKWVSSVLGDDSQQKARVSVMEMSEDLLGGDKDRGVAVLRDDNWRTYRMDDQWRSQGLLDDAESITIVDANKDAIKRLTEQNETRRAAREDFIAHEKHLEEVSIESIETRKKVWEHANDMLEESFLEGDYDRIINYGDEIIEMMKKEQAWAIAEEWGDEMTEESLIRAAIQYLIDPQDGPHGISGMEPIINDWRVQLMKGYDDRMFNIYGPGRIRGGAVPGDWSLAMTNEGSWQQWYQTAVDELIRQGIVKPMQTDRGTVINPDELEEALWNFWKHNVGDWRPEVDQWGAARTYWETHYRKYLTDEPDNHQMTATARDFVEDLVANYIRFGWDDEALRVVTGGAVTRADMEKLFDQLQEIGDATHRSQMIFRDQKYYVKSPDPVPPELAEVPIPDNLADPKPTPAIGVAVEEAYRQYAQRIADTTLQAHRTKVKEVMTLSPRAEGVRIARRAGNGYEELQPGARFAQREDLYIVDDKGRVAEAVDYGDPRYFDASEDSDAEAIMWGIVGPMIRDHYEEVGGLTRWAPRTFKERRGPFNRLRPTQIDEELTAEQTVRYTRARVEDVGNEPKAFLPNTTITRSYEDIPNSWWDRTVRWGFDKVIGPAIDSLARDPMAYYNFHHAYVENMRNLDWLIDRKLFDTDLYEAFGHQIASLEADFDDGMKWTAGWLAKREGVAIDVNNPTEVAQFMHSQMPDGTMDYLQWVQDLRSARRTENANEHLAAYMAENGITSLDTRSHYEVVQQMSPDDLDRNMGDLYSLNNWSKGHMKAKIQTPSLDGKTGSRRMIQYLIDEFPQDLWDEPVNVIATYLERTSSKAKLPFRLGQTGNSYQEVALLKSAVKNMRHARKTAVEAAAMRAINNMVPFIDSHEQRSMFAEVGRNMIPFWYAEENFIKRWARTLAAGRFATPWGPVPSMGLDVMRKAQLTYMGLKHAAVIRTDANGEDWVVYPGSSLLTDALAKVMPGDKEPIGVLYAATTDSLLPGMTPDNTVTPSPFVALPVHALGHFMPDAKPMKDAILGPIGSQRSVASQFVPAVVANSWQALFQNEDSSAQYGTAMMQAIAYAEAEGRGLPDNASSDDVDKYLDQIRNHARIILFGRALAGFVVPGAPRPQAFGEDSLTGIGVEDPEEITSELYRTYIRRDGLEEGTAAFLKDFPNADLEDVVNPLAFTASATDVVSRAPLPATEVGMEWYRDNTAWVNALPEAGAWLMPQVGKDSFEYSAYRQQLASGLRKRRAPREFIRSMKYRSAADTYFRNKEQYEEAVLQVGDNQDEKRRLDAVWENFKTPFLAANPIFAEELQNGTSRIRRGRTIEQMRYAVTDPQMPDSPYSAGITKLVNAFDTYEMQATILRDDGTAKAREQLRQLKRSFDEWGTAWSLQYPDLERLWTSVYRIEAEL